MPGHSAIGICGISYGTGDVQKQQLYGGVGWAPPLGGGGCCTIVHTGLEGINSLTVVHGPMTFLTPKSYPKAENGQHMSWYRFNKVMAIWFGLLSSAQTSTGVLGAFVS